MTTLLSNNQSSIRRRRDISETDSLSPQYRIPNGKPMKSPDHRSIQALKAQQTVGTVITYTMVANHLSTAVSELPEDQVKNRSVSGIRVAGLSGGHSDTDGIYNADGSIKTGYISYWRSLSSEDKDKVTAERKRLNMNSNEKKRISTDSASDASTLSTIKQPRAQNKKHKRKNKALKKRSTVPEGGDGKKDGDVDAGDQFGGKGSKKKSKH